MKEIKLFDVKIETWASTITIRAWDQEDAENLARALFKVPTDKEVKAVAKLNDRREKAADSEYCKAHDC